MALVDLKLFGLFDDLPTWKKLKHKENTYFPRTNTTLAILSKIWANLNRYQSINIKVTNGGIISRVKWVGLKLVLRANLRRVFQWPRTTDLSRNTYVSFMVGTGCWRNYYHMLPWRKNATIAILFLWTSNLSALYKHLLTVLNWHS